MIIRSFLSILLIFFSFSTFASNIDEMVLDDDPYIGVKIDFSNYQPMVYLSNITEKLNPSEYAQKNDRLITSLSESKTATSDLFKNNKKIVSYLDPNKEYVVIKVVKTAVYKNNFPDEYTLYVLQDNDGAEYTIPDFELKDISTIKLSAYEKGLIEEFNKQNNYARVVIYFEKPDLYAEKKAPYSQEELQSVFNFFLDRIKHYKVDKVLFSDRNFRLSLSTDINTLVYLVSEYENLYIEDLEVISTFEKANQEQAYNYAVPVKKNNNNLWYNR